MWIRSRRTKPRPGRLAGADLEALRLACWQRDHRCRYCKRSTIFDAPHEHPDAFHMAHIGAKRRYGDSLENTETNCGDCHRRYHNYGPSMKKPVPAKVRVDASGD